jgi:hypothetical protein
MIQHGNALGMFFTGADEQGIAFAPHYAMHALFPEDAAVAAHWAEIWRKETEARWA